MQTTTSPILYEGLGGYHTIIKVPMASVDAYKNAPGWSNYSSQISGY